MHSTKSVAVFAAVLGVVGFLGYQATTASSGSVAPAEVGKQAGACCASMVTARAADKPENQCGDKKKDCEKKCGDEKKDREKKCGDAKKDCEKKVGG